MARTYKLLSAEPHSDNKENILAVIEVTDGAEVFTIKTFAHDLTPEYLAKVVGLKEANVMESRKTGLAALKAMVGQTITPTAPTAPEDTTARDAYFAAVRNVAELTELVRLKIVAEDDAEYVAAIQAAKDARAALKG